MLTDRYTMTNAGGRAWSEVSLDTLWGARTRCLDEAPCSSPGCSKAGRSRRPRQQEVLKSGEPACARVATRTSTSSPKRPAVMSERKRGVTDMSQASPASRGIDVAKAPLDAALIVDGQL